MVPPKRWSARKASTISYFLLEFCRARAGLIATKQATGSNHKSLQGDDYGAMYLKTLLNSEYEVSVIYRPRATLGLSYHV